MTGQERGGLPAVVSTEAWIQLGTEVLCFTTGHRTGEPYPVRAKILRVAAKSFVVDRPHEPRFPIDTLSVRGRGTWDAWTRHVVPLDSDEARAVLARQHRIDLVRAAREACATYDRKPTAANRLAAIEALQAVEEDR